MDSITNELLPMDAMTVGNETSSNKGDDGVAWSPGNIVLSIALFLIAGLLEIGGGYLVWIGLRNKFYPAICIPLGSLVLIAYGIVPTFQPLDSFGRTFAVYGGFFIALSYMWAAIFDGFRPDMGDIVGGVVAVVGVCIAWFWPR